MRIRAGASVAFIGLAFGAAALPVPAAAAPAAATSLRITDASIDGRSLFGDTRARPVKLDPRDKVPMSITVVNTGTEPVHVRYLRINGALLGIRFVRFQADVSRDVAPGATVTIAQPADFFDLDHAATGYIDAKVQVVDENRVTRGSHAFSAEVDGRVFSSIGVFFFEVLAFSLIGLVEILFGLARRRLRPNRFVRALTFALAIGSAALAVVIGLSMLSIALLPASSWVPAVLIPTAVGFALGFVSPGRAERRADEAVDDRVVDLVAEEAVARASGQHERRTTGGSVTPQTSGSHAAADVDTTTGPTQHDSGGFTPQHDSGPVQPLQ